MKKSAIIFLVVAAAMLAVLFLRKPPTLVVQAPGQSLPQPTPAPNPPATPPKLEDLTGKQVIVFAFDGSKDLTMWQDSLDFAKTMTQEAKPIHFTYFISGVYLVSYKNKTLYEPPIYPAGTSKIGFANSQADVIKRIGYINRAVEEGHEIGSHLNGHFDGTKWLAENWEQEFAQFEKLVANVNLNNQIDPTQAKLDISQKDIIGFRAPNLGRNLDLWPILVAHNYQYDTSVVGQLGDMPKKQNGVWEFTIPSIKYANTNSHLLSMDYNFYVKQTNAQDLFKAGTKEWDQALDETYQSYINYFQTNFSSNKAPVFIAHHFSKWNDGVYWEALKKFAQEECGKIDVRCVTYKELMDSLNNGIINR